MILLTDLQPFLARVNDSASITTQINVEWTPPAAYQDRIFVPTSVVGIAVPQGGENITAQVLALVSPAGDTNPVEYLMQSLGAAVAPNTRVALNWIGSIYVVPPYRLRLRVVKNAGVLAINSSLAVQGYCGIPRSPGSRLYVI